MLPPIPPKLHSKTHLAAKSQKTWGWAAALHWPSAVKTQDIVLLFYYIESRAQPHTKLQHVVQKTPKHCYEGYFYSYPGKPAIFCCPTEPAQTSLRTQLTGRRENRFCNPCCRTLWNSIIYVCECLIFYVCLTTAHFCSMGEPSPLLLRQVDYNKVLGHNSH